MAAACLAGALIANPAQAQEDSDAGDDSVRLVCDDGSEFVALFGERDVEITLADGTKIKLPEKPGGDDGFLFTNGKMQLKGDEEKVLWIVGKKAPVNCQFDQGPQYAHFDQPITVDSQDLPPDSANPDMSPVVSCYRFADFMIKEVDLGEKGAAKLAILPPKAACQKDDPAEKLISGDEAGYFLGAKGKFLFFQAADGWNGGLPFAVYDSQSAKRLFSDSFEGEDFVNIVTDGTKLTIDFRRVHTASCTMMPDNAACIDMVKKETGLGEGIAVPDCKASYDEEMKRTPDYAKEIGELPSVISYQAKLVFDGTKATVTPEAGETACRVPD
ncbi:hypothetical protein [Rhizobium alvei]|uniref:C-type lysozyme inhibitor domain-containing protein n=1 Tax=Rhizobium alvei TaxID=1132659 RepID=A0ABT8YPL8_9HYPH|nr:hypothetical protein [Rhizobium alvei]MDO6965670.1 hypothetical protein [Rhizobium alvei]